MAIRESEGGEDGYGIRAAGTSVAVWGSWWRCCGRERTGRRKLGKNNSLRMVLWNAGWGLKGSRFFRMFLSFRFSLRKRIKGSLRRPDALDLLFGLPDWLLVMDESHEAKIARLTGLCAWGLGS